MVDHEDPNTWTKEYVISNRIDCLQLLQEVNLTIVHYINEGNYLGAVVGLDRVLNGLVTMHNSRSYDGKVRTAMSALSFVEGSLLSFADLGLSISEDDRRSRALALFKDSQDFARTKRVKQTSKRVIKVLESGMSLAMIKSEYAEDFPEGLTDILEDVNTNFFIPALSESADGQKISSEQASSVSVTHEKSLFRKQENSFDEWMQITGWNETDLERAYKKVKFRRNIYGILSVFPPLGFILLPFWFRAVYLTKAIRYRSWDVDFNIFTKIIFFLYGIPTLFIYPLIMLHIVKWSNWGMGLGDKRGRVLTLILVGVLAVLLVRSLNLTENLGSLFNRISPSNDKVEFSDVPDDKYYSEAVKWAVSKDISNGTTADTFSPNDTCTVAQILTFLYRTNGSPSVNISNPFANVSESKYYYSAALWAYQNGLVSDSDFDPSAPCTRSMVVTYLWKLAGSPAVSESGSDYAPYTISGDGWSSESSGGATPMTITFSAASVKKEILPFDAGGGEWDMEEFMANETEFESLPVTMITLQPGSTISFSNDLSEIDMMYGWSTPDYPEFSALYGGTTLDFYYGVAIETLPAGNAETVRGERDGEVLWVSPIGFQDADSSGYFLVYGSDSVSGFSDVPSGAPYAQAVAWAVEKGITTGDTANTFSPDKTCTRGQIVTFLYRAYAD